MALFDEVPADDPRLVRCACGLPAEYCGLATRDKATAELFQRVCTPWRKTQPENVLRAAGIEIDSAAETASAGKEEKEDANASTTTTTTTETEAAASGENAQAKLVLKKGGKQAPKIQVQRLMRGKKSVTSVVNLDAHLKLTPDGPQHAEAAKLMAKFFACASAVKKDSDDEIVIQGDVADKVAAFLTEKFGIDAGQVGQNAKAGKVKGRPPPRKR